MLCVVYQELSFASDEPLWERVERRELKANNIRSDPWAPSSPLGAENELQAGGRETFNSRGSDSFIGQEMWLLTSSLMYKHNVYIYEPPPCLWTLTGRGREHRKEILFLLARHREKFMAWPAPVVSKRKGHFLCAARPESSKDTITFIDITHSKATP